MEIAEILAVLSPLTTATIFIAGLVMGFIYVSQVDLSRHFGYNNLILATAFFSCLTIVRLIEGFEHWERWIGGFILYLVYTVAIIIGKTIYFKVVK